MYMYIQYTSSTVLMPLSPIEKSEAEEARNQVLVPYTFPIPFIGRSKTLPLQAPPFSQTFSLIFFFFGRETDYTQISL